MRRKKQEESQETPVAENQIANRRAASSVGSAGESVAGSGLLQAGLLQTKLTIPPRVSTLIPRPAIVARAQAGVEGRLTLISAPPGFGKTMLAVTAFAPPPDDLAVAWVTLDAGDNDLRRFLLYFVAALEHAVPGALPGMTSLLESPHAPPEAALVTLVNRLLALSRRVALVLDDYHVIETPAIHNALSFLLDQTIPALHLVVLTRADPPLALGRLRAQGLLNEIRAHNLRFDLEEARRFLRDVMQIPLPDADLAILAGRTEGWIAGLHLAALSLRQLQQPPVSPGAPAVGEQGEQVAGDVAGDVAARRSAFIRQFHGTHRHIIEYLSEEVLARLDATDREFVLRTSILPRFTASLCAFVLADDESRVAARLQRLVDANLFLLPLDATHTWFRYHQLFGDLLQAILRQETEDATLARLHSRAAQWARDQGDWLQAVEHAFATDNMDLIVDMVGQASSVLFSRGELATILAWIQRLPESVVRGNFYLALIKGWILLFGRQADQALPYLQAARRLFSPDLGPRSVLQLAHLEAQFALAQGEWVRAIEHTGRALAQTELLDPVFRGALLLLQAEAEESMGDLRRALVSYEAAATAMRPESSLFAYFGAQSALAFTLNGACKRRAAWQVAHRAWQQLEAQEFTQQPISAFILVALGRLCFEANDLDGAAGYLRGAQGLIVHMPSHRVLIDGLMLLARIELLHSHDQAAESIHDTVHRLAHDGQDAEFAGALATTNYLIAGNLAAAEQWVRTVEPGLDPQAYDVTRDDVYLACMGYWLACARQESQESDEARRGRLAALARWLSVLIDSAQTGGRAWVLLNGHLIAAQVAQLRDDADTLDNHLHAALELSAPDGYVRLWLDEGAELLPELGQAATKTRFAAHRTFIEQLLEQSPVAGAVQKAGSAPAVHPASTANSANAQLVDPLTPREQEVLQLVAQGLTNQEIAGALVLAVSTVKRHLANIFAKLEVNHRAAAIAQARSYGLLD